MNEEIDLYTEFGKGQKQECIRFCEEKKLAFFQRDLNSSSSKIFIASTYRDIYNKIKAYGVNKSYFYESWNANQLMRLYIDYDKKNDQLKGSEFDLKARVKKLDENPNIHKTDILNIINTIRELLPGITGVNILKSIPDHEKKSYHIVFDGLHFPKAKSIQVWLEEQLKPKFKDLFERKIIDMKVYSPICMRTLLSTKAGQSRPLYLLDTDTFLTELQENPISSQDTTFEQFLRTCITNIEPDSLLFNYKSEKKKDNCKKVHLMNDEDIYTDKEVVKKYLDILDPERYTDRSKWLCIGYMLSSINRDYIDLWHYFSSKWQNYSERDTDIAWDSFVNSEYIYTVENLKYLSKIDNPEDYTELTKEIPNHDIKYLRPFDNILSKLIHRLYSEIFVCSDCEKGIWYFFNSTRWRKENKSFNLRKRVIDEVFSKIESYRRQLVKEGASEEIIKNYYSILSRLGSGIRLNCLEIEFYNSQFDSIIDQDKDLLGFDNGVYDLVNSEFRKGRNSDYISLTTGYEYIHYPEDHRLYIELYQLICKILPDEETRDFTLKSLASCLDGHNRDENFYLWAGRKGSGANGKSTLSDLHLKALGEYACISPVSLITGKRESANNANSALFSIRNKRCVLMQEPAANDHIQVDVMKSLTGGDSISTRELNSSQVTFKPNAKFFLATNRLPGLSSNDGGTSRRLKITEFTSRFVDNPSEERGGIYEFLIDRELKSKIDSFAPVFMCILINYYNRYRKEGLRPPESVLKVTKKFEADNDIIKEFIDEHILVGKNNDCITREELKEFFNKEYTLKSNFGKLSNFITQIENSLGADMRMDTKRKIQKLSGYYIREPEQPDDDDEINVDTEINQELN
jgi:P4 family phage/plasmid primase-like protien